MAETPDTAAPRSLVPLRWTAGRYSSHFGTVGKIPHAVASINWSTTRADPKPYIVRVSLPGLDGTRRQAETLDEAKAVAAAMVNKWLRDAQEATNGT
jgi:hypothetical protein